MDVVREEPLAVQLDDRQELAVRGLEGLVTADVDLAELEPELLPERDELCARALAQMTALRVVERDHPIARGWRRVHRC
jgi:hypothetical protein